MAPLMEAIDSARGRRLPRSSPPPETDAAFGHFPSQPLTDVAWQEAPTLAKEPSRPGDMILPTLTGFVVERLAWVRDMSDLSANYFAGRSAPPTAGTVAASHRSELSQTSQPRPWRAAVLLSSRVPSRPQPHGECDDSIVRGGRPPLDGLVELRPDGDRIEVVSAPPATGEEFSSLGLGRLPKWHRCTPVVVLLMDPLRRLYELMQLWVDVESDTIRDVLEAVQRQLVDRPEWRTDYDGLFQVRNGLMTQLLHVVDLGRHRPQPYEVFVAKPWRLGSPACQAHARELLEMLRGVRVLQEKPPARPPAAPRAASHADASAYVRPDDRVLCLSREARARTYVPGGVRRHRHACQFLAFSPPFAASPPTTPTAPPVRLDVLGSRGGIRDSPELDASSHPSGAPSASDRSSAQEAPRPYIQFSVFPPVVDTLRIGQVLFAPACADAPPTGEEPRSAAPPPSPAKAVPRRRQPLRWLRWATGCGSRHQLEVVVDGGGGDGADGGLDRSRDGANTLALDEEDWEEAASRTEPRSQASASAWQPFATDPVVPLGRWGNPLVEI